MSVGALAFGAQDDSRVGSCLASGWRSSARAWLRGERVDMDAVDANCVLQAAGHHGVSFRAVRRADASYRRGLDHFSLHSNLLSVIR